jgi:hypothetical protein
MSDYHCWRCQQPLNQLILPLSRREECGHCQADQHVCKMCEHYARGRCDEDRADTVSDPDKANFCDYFQLSHRSTTPNTGLKPDKNEQAKAKLAALFGDPFPETTSSDEPLSPSELAEKKLRDLLSQSGF